MSHYKMDSPANQPKPTAADIPTPRPSLGKRRADSPASSLPSAKKGRFSHPSHRPPSRTESSDSSGSQPPTDKYRYKSIGPGSIRILTVLPRGDEAFDSPLDCRLSRRRNLKRHANDQDITLYYEALSYVWGEETAEDSEDHIYIASSRSSKGKKVMNVSRNLLLALRHLRKHDEPRSLWIDAVCINQGDNDELSEQVPLMAEIYSQARSVCIWLGDSDPLSHQAMRLLPKIRDMEHFEQILENETTTKEWAALIALMGRPWFTRRWVVQEIALARQATIHCGKDEVPWSQFSQAIALFQDGAVLVSRKFSEDRTYKHDGDYVGDVGAYAASRLVAATSRAVRKSKANDVLLKVRSLEYLVATLTPFNAKKMADSIYAVLSLANDVPGYSTVIAPSATIDTSASTPEPSLPNSTELDEAGRKYALKVVSKMRNITQKYPVDYNKPFTEICVDFLKFVFATSKSLDMICRPWAPKDAAEGLPSWILTLKDDLHVQRRNCKTMIRRRADVLVNDPGNPFYSASGRYPMVWEIIDKVPSSEPNCPEITLSKPRLQVQGFILDIISEREDAAHTSTVPNTWFELGGWDTSKEESPPEEFWRTLVADRGPDGENPPAWYPLACAHTLLFFSTEGDAVSLDRVAKQLDDPTLLKKYVRRLQAVIWGRRLARTEKHNFLALIPQQAKEGDIICIVPGISVPVVLRRRNEGGFIFIGESYVHTMMDGEAFVIKREWGTKYEMFELH